MQASYSDPFSVLLAGCDGFLVNFSQTWVFVLSGDTKFSTHVVGANQQTVNTFNGRQLFNAINRFYGLDHGDDECFAVAYGTHGLGREVTVLELWHVVSGGAVTKGLEFGCGNYVFSVLYRADVWYYDTHGAAIKYARDKEWVFGWNAHNRRYAGVKRCYAYLACNMSVL